MDEANLSAEGECERLNDVRSAGRKMSSGQILEYNAYGPSILSSEGISQSC